MAAYKVAHVKEQGQDIIFVFVGRQLSDQQLTSLQLCASEARLAGTVVPIWRYSFSRFAFTAPLQWHSYISSLTWNCLVRAINKSLSCG